MATQKQIKASKEPPTEQAKNSLSKPAGNVAKWESARRGLTLMAKGSITYFMATVILVVGVLTLPLVAATATSPSGRVDPLFGVMFLVIFGIAIALILTGLIMFIVGTVIASKIPDETGAKRFADATFLLMFLILALYVGQGLFTSFVVGSGDSVGEAFSGARIGNLYIALAFQIATIFAVFSAAMCMSVYLLKLARFLKQEEFLGDIKSSIRMIVIAGCLTLGGVIYQAAVLSGVFTDRYTSRTPDYLPLVGLGVIVLSLLISIFAFLFWWRDIKRGARIIDALVDSQPQL